jgi:8-oxo-dGTP pyrophosphatase MutT (NUDIX family)
VIAPGEDPAAAAGRELLEEVGYAAADWRLLGRVATEPSRHTNYGVIFAATGAHASAAPNPDATEDLVTRLVPATEVAAMAMDGRIIHGVHVAAALWAARAGVLPL